MKTTTYWEISNVIGQMRNILEDVTSCAGDDLRVGVGRRSHRRGAWWRSGRFGTQLVMKETVLFDEGGGGIRNRIHSKVVIGVEEDEEKNGHIYSKRSWPEGSDTKVEFDFMWDINDRLKRKREKVKKELSCDVETGGWRWKWNEVWFWSCRLWSTAFLRVRVEHSDAVLWWTLRLF